MAQEAEREKEVARVEALRLEEEQKLKLEAEERERLRVVEEARLLEEKKLEEKRQAKKDLFLSLKGTDQLMHSGSVTCQGGDSLVSFPFLSLFLS